MSRLLFSVPKHLLSSYGGSRGTSVFLRREIFGNKLERVGKCPKKKKKERRRKGTGGEQIHRYEKSAADLWDSGLRTAVELVIKAEPRAHSLRAPTQEPPVKS